MTGKYTRIWKEPVEACVNVIHIDIFTTRRPEIIFSSCLLLRVHRTDPICEEAPLNTAAA